MTQLYLDSDVKNFVDALTQAGGKPLYELTPQQAREVLHKTQASPQNLPPADITEINAPLGNGRNMRIQIIKPLNAADALPLIYYIHGGGWVMGDEITHARLIRTLAAQTNAAVVFPIYEPSPEAQYPQITLDLYTALQYIVEHGTKFSIDTTRVAVAGDSVGGNMALVMSLLAKQKNTPKIIFQLLLYPVASADFSTSSYQTFAQGPWLTAKAMQWFWDQYAPNADSRLQIQASPLNASLAELAGLPPTLVITDENDVLRDEGEALARKLNQAGVKTASVRINGTIHDFLMLNALADSAPSQAALLLIVESLKQIFAQSAQLNT